jgi:hypothetical protein
MKRLTIAILFLSSALPLAAWTRKGDHAIANRSAELAPPDLRLLIEKFHVDYETGLDHALADEGSELHRAKLRGRIEAETNAIVKMIRSNQPMPLVIQHLGLLAHLTGDANNPFHIGDDSPAEHQDFENYFERRLNKFAGVFYGVDRNLQLPRYLDSMFARSTKFAPLMSEEYTRGSSADFDDHSTAFGVASLCYSHAVTDTVNLYYFIWKQAGGDVRHVPRSSVVVNGRD